MQRMADKLLGGNYQVLEEREHGLKCRDVRSETTVWLKPLASEIAAEPALMAEAVHRCEELKGIKHAGIVQMLDVVPPEDGKAYMVMEYVEGVTLRQWMQAHRHDGIIPAVSAIPMLKQLAFALDAAHSQKEIHRHLMPESIMVDEKGNAKILNFGIPYVGSDNAWMLEPWKSIGWEAFYRAPEQWRGQICTPWTDMYALGCIAYEMLSGHVPFDIPDLSLLHGAVLMEMPPAIFYLSTAAQGTIARSLAKRGSERFSSCEDYIRSLSFETTPTTTVPRTKTDSVPTLQQSKSTTSNVPSFTPKKTTSGNVPSFTHPKSTTGSVPLLSQDGEPPAALNPAWAMQPAEAANPYVPAPQDTGAVKGVTRTIPIALPNMPNTGMIRFVTSDSSYLSRTGSVDRGYSHTTSRVMNSTSHVMNSTSHVMHIKDPLETEAWGEDIRGVKGVFLKFLVPVLMVAAVASIMYYLIIRQMNELSGGSDDVPVAMDQDMPIPHPELKSLEDAEELLKKTQSEEKVKKALEKIKEEVEEDEEEEEEEEDEPEARAPKKESPVKAVADADSSNRGGEAAGGRKTSSNVIRKMSDVVKKTTDAIKMKAVEGKEEPAAQDDEETTAANRTDSQEASDEDDKGAAEEPDGDGAMSVIEVAGTGSAPRDGAAMIEVVIDGKVYENIDVKVDGVLTKQPVEIEASMSEKRKVRLEAEYQNERLDPYYGEKTFTIEWYGLRTIRLELKKKMIVAAIIATIDGEPVDGVEIIVEGNKYKTPDCEIEWDWKDERKVDVKAFYHDKEKGMFYGTLSFENHWLGRKEVYVELEGMKMMSPEEKVSRLLPLGEGDFSAVAPVDGGGNPPAAGVQEATAQKTETAQVRKPVFMELLWVEPGSFEMGSDTEDAMREERPRHSVHISNGFWLGKFEVTQEEYRALAQYAGLDLDQSYFRGDRRPVESITRNAAKKWCEAVTLKERQAGRLPSGYVYRLPTEAEWEYAARGGRNSRGYVFSGGNKLEDVAWFDGNLGENGTKTVGEKQGNELGFHDMSGNVREWCHDDFESYTLAPATDPFGRGDKAIARGGSWRNNLKGNRVTERGNYKPDKAEDFIGFRVALAPALAE